MSVVPQHWQGSPRFRTRTALLAFRKREFLPDPSFDLDGDGEVGPTDLFVATRFDSDKDKKLSRTERAAAEAAIKEGFLDQFEFGAENHGAHRPNRLVQVRGVIINDNDFTRLQPTYLPPSHGRLPSFRTATELRASRKAAAINEASAIAEQKIRHKKALLQFEHKLQMSKPVPLPYKLRNRQDCREAQGMLRHSDALRPRELPLEYTPYPHFRCHSELKEARRVRMVESQEATCNYGHKGGDARLNERELAILRNTPEPRGNLVKAKRKAQRHQDFEYNVEHFGKRSLGIHGIELPKFRDHAQEYWKLRSDYVLREELEPPVTDISLQKEQPKQKGSVRKVLFRKSERGLSIDPTKSKTGVTRGGVIDDTVRFGPSKTKHSFSHSFRPVDKSDRMPRPLNLPAPPRSKTPSVAAEPLQFRTGGFT